MMSQTGERRFGSLQATTLASKYVYVCFSRGQESMDVCGCHQWASVCGGGGVSIGWKQG